MKNNKGITLVALIITIIIVIVILGISVGGGSDVLQKSKMTEYIGFMKLVKARADVVFEEELFSTDDISTVMEIGIDDVKKIDGEGGTTSFDSKINGYNGKSFIKWNKDKIAHQGIDSSILGTDEYFVIVYDKTNYETVDVIYSAGCGYNGNRYYTLTEMEDKIKSL